MVEEKAIKIGEIQNWMKAVKNIKIKKPQKCLLDSISDLYYRENFHSDILAYYLSDDLVKEKLIDWINRCFKENTPEKWIDFSLYKGGPDPKREEGRRDITIYSKDEEHAIIIENKSNGAGDMPYQIPRYYADLKSQKKYVDAIIYLNKEYCKQPNDMCCWTSEKKEILEIFQQSEKKQVSEYISDIKNKLVIATLNRGNGFTQNVIDDVLKESVNIRLSGLSHEIKNLFKNLVHGVYMEYKQVEEMLNYINGNTESFSKLIGIYKQLPKIMCDYYFQEAQKKIIYGEEIKCCFDGEHLLFYIESTLDKSQTCAVNFDFSDVYNQNMIKTLYVRYNKGENYQTKLKTFMDAGYGKAIGIEDDKPHIVASVFNKEVILKQISDVIEFFREQRG